jgi:hypothetical protein
MTKSLAMLACVISLSLSPPQPRRLGSRHVTVDCTARGRIGSIVNNLRPGDVIVNEDAD